MTTDVNVPYSLKKEYDKGIAQCRKALDLDPNFYLANFVLGWIEVQRGTNYATAIEKLGVAKRMNKQPFITAHLGFAYARNGQKDKAMEILQELNRLASQRFVSPFCQALVYLGLREDDKALAWLEKSYERGLDWVGRAKGETVLRSNTLHPPLPSALSENEFPAVSDRNFFS